jgi:AcrR family transcriptional regulator
MARNYQSRLREAAAAATRAKITAAARALFSADGYAGTSIDAVARAAGVAVQTVYASYGTKRAILFAILDQADRDAGGDQLTASLGAASGNPRKQLEAMVAFTARFYTVNADVVAVARQTAGVEPDLAALWQTGEARRRTAQTPLVKSWAPVLRKGLKPAEALDVLWSMTGADIYHLFVEERGWSVKRFERWAVETLTMLLFER